MLVDEIKKFSSKINSEIYFDYDLKKSNWFNIGGKTKVYFRPESLSDLVIFLKNFGDNEKIFILGAGSNTLISDRIFDGIVIKLGKNFSNVSLLPNDIIVAGSACADKKLSDFAMENEIGGLEFLACIPGTIGGGLKMNAGCFNREFKDILISVQAIDRSGRVVTIPADKVIFEYRNNNLDKDLIFLSASFKGKRNDKIRIKNEILDGTEGGYTKGPDNSEMSIYDASMKFQEEGTPLVIFGGEQYGAGSSRDWAAKGTALLGVKAVIAENFERIHRSNLVGMGVIPFEFTNGQTRTSLKLIGDEIVSITGLEENLRPWILGKNGNLVRESN